MENCIKNLQVKYEADTFGIKGVVTQKVIFRIFDLFFTFDLLLKIWISCQRRLKMQPDDTLYDALRLIRAEERPFQNTGSLAT